MHALKAALDRLGHAVGRLEHAAANREIRFSRREHELSEALTQARAETARANENADAVSKRLETAIGRLEAVLET
ncbi:MAG TPA: hypothetical protein VD995_01910 [Azospirillum sp.]|nr:hypothetical protein [Azospirillum sp.]